MEYLVKWVVIGGAETVNSGGDQDIRLQVSEKAANLRVPLLNAVQLKGQLQFGTLLHRGRISNIPTSGRQQTVTARIDLVLGGRAWLWQREFCFFSQCKEMSK
ncbi:hypothetical protein Ancab_022602 [Ancistrocladus abbreviatus]